MSTYLTNASQTIANLQDAIRTGQDHLSREHLTRITGPLMEAIVAGEMSVLETLHTELDKVLILIVARAHNTRISYRLQGMIEVIIGMAGDTVRRHRLAAPIAGAGQSVN